MRKIQAIAMTGVWMRDCLTWWLHKMTFFKPADRGKGAPEMLASYPCHCCYWDTLPNHHSFAKTSLCNIVCTFVCSFTSWSRVHVISGWITYGHEEQSRCKLDPKQGAQAERRKEESRSDDLSSTSVQEHGAHICLLWPPPEHCSLGQNLLYFIVWLTGLNGYQMGIQDIISTTTVCLGRWYFNFLESISLDKQRCLPSLWRYQ